MARPLRVEYPGAIYHVTCRMVGEAMPSRQVERALSQPPAALFRDDADREHFLECLAERSKQFEVRVFTFCLMTNHFHLVIETPHANCGRFMHSLITAYTVYFNLRHSRTGHLTGGRYKAKLVEGDTYLLALSRYVHLNPVHVGEIERRSLDERLQFLRQYRWSSYRRYMGSTREYEFLVCGPLWSLVPGLSRQGPANYRKYVEQGLAADDLEFKEMLALSPRSIGSEAFRARIDALYRKQAEASRQPEDVAFRRTAGLLAPETVLGVVAEELGVTKDDFKRRSWKSPLRATAAIFLMRYSGLSQRDVASILQSGSGSAVSKQISRWDRKYAVKSDIQARRVKEKISRRLDELRGNPGLEEMSNVKG